MQRLWQRTQQEQLDYHLKRNDTPNFTEGQPGRIDLAHFLIDKMLLKGDLPADGPLKIIELGCGSGDISGPYSMGINLRGGRWVAPADVVGIDVVPQALSAQKRFPRMDILISPVEELEPIECDLLVMCEFLEHVYDPWSIVKAWMPKAKWAIIGHPLNEPDPPYETGHLWSYDLPDWYAWFEGTGFHVWERFLFPMGYYENMVIGHGSRKDLPPFAS